MDKKKVAITSFILGAGLLMTACSDDSDKTNHKNTAQQDCKNGLTELKDGGYKCERTHSSGIPMWYFMGRSFTNESSYNSAVSSYKNSPSQSKKNTGITESNSSSSQSSSNANKSNTNSSKSSIGTGGSGRGSSSGG